MNSKSKKILAKILSGKADYNIRFQDFYNIILNLGFEFDGQDGTSHIQFYHPKYDVYMNVQKDDGTAKPYQVRQLRKLIQKYKMG